MTLADPVKQHHFAVRFEWGSSDLPNPDVPNIDDTPDVLLLTNHLDGVTIDADDYTPLQALEFTFPKLTGGLQEDETKIELPVGYLDTELHTGPHARVAVLIYEFVDGDSGDEQVVAFRGEIFRVVANPQDHDGTIALTCYGPKKMLEMSQTCVPASDKCVFKLFGPGCFIVHTDTGPPLATTEDASEGPTVETEIEAAEITLIDGQYVTVEVAEKTGRGRLWEDGYLEFRGLRLKIMEWDDADQTPLGGGLVTTTFRLVKKPPTSWTAAILRAVPGCNKSIEKCRESYDNEKQFNGVGYASLAYNPMISSP